MTNEPRAKILIAGRQVESCSVRARLDGRTLGRLEDHGRIDSGGIASEKVSDWIGPRRMIEVDEPAPPEAEGPWSDVVVYAEEPEDTVAMCPYCLCTDCEAEVENAINSAMST